MQNNYCKLVTEEKEKIANTILTSVMNEVREIYLENKLQHRNAYTMLVWDFIGSRIIENLKSTRLKVKKIKRGRYSFDLIIDEENQTAYTIMKKSNVAKVKKEQKISHYLWALASINSDLEIAEGQMNLFSFEGENSYKEKTRKELLKDVDSIISRYGTIVINDDNKQFPAIELHVYDMNLNCKYEEVWKEALVLDYNFDYEENDEENDIVYNVRFKDEDKQDLLKIRNDESKKNIEKEG